MFNIFLVTLAQRKNTHIVTLAEAEADRIITASFKVCDTGWEGQAETPGGFQDTKHEVKDGPLGRTALLRPGTHARTHTRRHTHTQFR